MNESVGMGTLGQLGFLQVSNPRQIGMEMLACELLKLQIGHLNAKSNADEYERLAEKCARAARAAYKELSRAV